VKKYHVIACLLALLWSKTALAQACIVETGNGATRVKLCQQNRSIPASLFANGFCKPSLSGQTAKVTMVDKCPTGAFGVCRNAQTSGAQIPYQQDIYYYGVQSDARFLQPACQQQNRGTWQPLNQPGRH